MDSLLLPYLQATDESERQRHLDELILHQAGPLVMYTLRQKLDLHIDPDGKNASHADAEDLYQEIITRIIQKLIDLRTAPAGNEIEHFRQYASRAAANACMDRLRSKRPVRRQLKDSIRYAVTKHPDLAIWRADRGYECGLAGWLDLDQRSTSRRPRIGIEEELNDFRYSLFSHEDVTKISLTRLLAELFDWIDGPVELDRLVEIVATLLKLEIEVNPVTLIDEDRAGFLESRIGRMSPSNSSALDALHLLRRLWESAKRLPAEQRDSFSFYFQDENGNDLFSLLIEAGIVTLPQLAREFGRSVQEIRRLRPRLPMDGDTVAAELDTSAGQANTWRYRAVKRLKKELLPPDEK